MSNGAKRPTQHAPTPCTQRSSAHVSGPGSQGNRRLRSQGFVKLALQPRSARRSRPLFCGRPRERQGEGRGRQHSPLWRRSRPPLTWVLSPKGRGDRLPDGRRRKDPLRAQSFEWRTKSLELGAKSLELGAKSFELRTTSLELRTTRFELRTTRFELRTTSLELRALHIFSPRQPNCTFMPAAAHFYFTSVSG
jgi:hypothetical protein